MIVHPNRLRTGQVLVHHRGAWSLIGLWTRWVHVDIVGVLYGVPMAFGATVPHVTAVNAHRIAQRDAEVLVLQPTLPAVRPEVDQLHWLLRETGVREYDLSGLGQLAVRLPLGLRAGKSYLLDTSVPVICSAWGDEFLELFYGINVAEGIADRWVVPRDYLYCPDLRELGRLEPRHV